MAISAAVAVAVRGEDARLVPGGRLGHALNTWRIVRRAVRRRRATPVDHAAARVVARRRGVASDRRALRPRSARRPVPIRLVVAVGEVRRVHGGGMRRVRRVVAVRLIVAIVVVVVVLIGVGVGGAFDARDVTVRFGLAQPVRGRVIVIVPVGNEQFAEGSTQAFLVRRVLLRFLHVVDGVDGVEDALQVEFLFEARHAGECVVVARTAKQRRDVHVDMNGGVNAWEATIFISLCRR